MSLKEIIRGNQFLGRKAAIREQLMPSQYPLNKPTRDISVSNRSHSINQEDPYLLPADRKIHFYQRENEEFQIERKANIIYIKQFKTLAKLLGNETLEFEQIRQRIENFILQQDPQPQQDGKLIQRIQYLEKQLAKKYMSHELSSKSHHNATSNEYLKTLENQLGKKSKLINELSDSIKRQTFQDAYHHLHTEVDEKQKNIRTLQQELHDYKVKTAANITFLEEQLVKHKQIIQKLTFQIGTWKRKSQSNADEAERMKKKQLSSSVQTKAHYQGISYGLSALLLQLQARDKQLQESSQEKQTMQSQIYALKDTIHNIESTQQNVKRTLIQSQQQIKILEMSHNKLQVSISRLSEQLRNSNTSLNKYTSQIHYHKTQLQIMTEEMNSLQVVNKQLNTIISDEETKRTELNVFIQRSKHEHYTILQENEKIRGEINQLIEINEQLNRGNDVEKQGWIKKVEQYQVEMKQRNSQKVQYQAIINRLKFTIQELKQQNVQYTHRLQEQNRIRYELQNEIDEIREIVQKLQRNQDNHENLKQEMIHERQKLIQSIGEKQKIISQLEGEMSQGRQGYEFKQRKYEQETQEIRKMLKESEWKLKQEKEERLQQIQSQKLEWKDMLDSSKQRQNNLQAQLQQLSTVINQLQQQKEELHRKIAQLETQSIHHKSDLATFTFNHYEKQSENIERLQERIEQLQRINADLVQKEERIRLQYSNTIELNSVQLLQSYKEQQNKLSYYGQKLQTQLRQKEQEILSRQNRILFLQEKLSHDQVQHKKITDMIHEIQNENSINKEKITQLYHERNNFITKIEQLQSKHHSLLEEATRNQVIIFNFNREVEQYVVEIKNYEEQMYEMKNNGEENKAMAISNYEKAKSYEIEINALREEINNAKAILNNHSLQQELESLKQQVGHNRKTIKQLEEKVEYLERELQKYERMSEKSVEQIQNQDKQQQFDNFEQRNRIISRLSRHSDVSAKNQANRSKYFQSDDDLSRQILNDPSKISGQQSKFGYNLIFDNSKININRQVFINEAINNIEIKQQKLQESVISKQIQNKEHDSSKQMNANNMSKYSHNTNSKKQVAIDNHVNQESSSNSIQHEQIHEPINQMSKHHSQQSMSASHSKEIAQHSLQASVNSLEQNIHIAEKEGFSMKKHSIIHHIPEMYPSRHSFIHQPIQERREENQSQSGSKTKINFSYLKNSNDASFEKHIRVQPELDGSRVSKNSRQSQQVPANLSINQVSPITLKNSQVKEQFSIINQRDSAHLKYTSNHASQKSIINAIRTPQLQNSMVRQNPTIIQFNRINEANLIRTETKPYVAQRKTISYNVINQPIAPRPNNIARLSSPITFPTTTQRSPQNVSYLSTQANLNTGRTAFTTQVIHQASSQPNNYQYTESIRVPQPQPESHSFKVDNNNEQKKNELLVASNRSNKIKMKTVYGKEGNSLLNDTATFGKNSGYVNKEVDNSVDSGIDVLQVDWQAPCCKND